MPSASSRCCNSCMAATSSGEGCRPSPPSLSLSLAMLRQHRYAAWQGCRATRATGHGAWGAQACGWVRHVPVHVHGRIHARLWQGL